MIHLRNCITLVALIASHVVAYEPWTKRDWHGINAWDPCRDLQWFVDQTKGSEPLYAGVETFTSPMEKDAKILPGSGDQQIDQACQFDAPTNTWKLQAGWEVFHRDLLKDDTKSDPNGGISYGKVGALAKGELGLSGTIPSFSIYHKHTGNLRTYIWRSSEVPIDGSKIGIDEFISDPLDNGDTRHGFSMEDPGYAMAVPLGNMWDQRPGSNLHWLGKKEPISFWMVVDRYLSYDPWSNRLNPELIENAPEGNQYFYSQRQEVLNFEIYGLETTDISVKGEFGNRVDYSHFDEGVFGIFAENSWISRGLRAGYTSGADQLANEKKASAITKYFHDKLFDDAIPKSACVEDKKAATKELGFWEGLLRFGFDQAVPPVLGLPKMFSGAVFDAVFGKRTTLQTQMLELRGIETTKLPNGRTSIPISPYRLNDRPFYFKYDAETNQPVHSTNIGLYNFYAAPKIKVLVVDERGTFIYPKGHRNYKDEVTDQGDETVDEHWSHYFITIDDPTCDLVINPEAGIQKVQIFAMPLTNTWTANNPKWTASPNFSTYLDASTIRGVYWKSVLHECDVNNDANCNDKTVYPNNDNTSLEMNIQFEYNGQLIVHQRMFPVDIAYEGVEASADYPTKISKDLGSTPSVASVGKRLADLLRTDKRVNMPVQSPTCTYDPATGRAKESENGPARRYMYDATITTGTSNHNGSDGTFKMSLLGCSGYEETFPLNFAGENPFETGRTGYFKHINPAEMGPLRKFEIHLTPKGTNPEWEMSSVKIERTDLFTGKRETIADDHPGSAWLSGKEKSLNGDWVYSHTVPGSETLCAEEATKQGNSGLATYSLEVSTQNVSIGATDAPLEIEVCGKVALKSETGYDAGEDQCWNETFQKTLMPNTTETFTTERVHFASLTSLRVKNKGNDWLAKDIVVKQNAQGATSSQTFAIRRWLEQGEEVTRKARVGTALEFTVTTDPKSGSGSNANVVAQLVGDANSEYYWWDNEGYDDFESSHTSVFLFYSEKTLGSLQTLHLFRDDEGKRPEWLVGEVNLKTIDLSVGIEKNDNFVFHEWLYSYGLYDIGRTKARTDDLTFVDNEGKTRTLGKRNGYSTYRNANADVKVDLTVSTSDMKSNYGTNQLSQVIAIDGADQKHYLIPQNLADDGFAAGSHQTFTTYREIIGGVKSVRILTKKTDDWMLLSTNIQINGVNGCFLDWNGQLLSTSNPNVIVADEEFFKDDSYIYLKQDCPNAKSDIPKIIGLKRSGTTIWAGENLELVGNGLDRNADDWQASLGSVAISVTGAVYNRLSLAIPAAMPSGTYALKVTNASSGIDWTKNVQLENPAPVLTSISHSVRKPGDVLEFKGTNFGAFSDAIAVKIGGKDAPLLRVLEDRISVRVPDLAPGVYTVPVTVFGKASAQVYSVTIEAVYPEITGLSPRMTLPGKTVTVYGAHFGSDVSLVKVYLGGNVLDPLTVTSSKLTFKVPDDMAYGDYKVQVSLRGYKAKTSLDLTLGGPPEVFSFDNPDFTWTCDEATVIRDVSVTNGSPASMALAGEGYRVARSPRFITDLLGEYSDTIAVDVYIPSGLSNPYWAGEIAMFLDLPAAGLNNSWLGNQQLTGLSTGAWHTLRFALNDGQLAALAGDYPGLQVALVLNAASADSYYRFDNLRFVGSNKVFRTARHVVGSRLLNILVPDVLGFESSSPWTAEPAIPLQFVTDPRVQGEHALQAKASGYVHLGSLPVRSWEWKAATSLLNLELYIPDPAPNPWWVGNVSVSLSCPEDGIYNRNLGQKDLTHLFRMEYNSIQIPLAADLVTQLQGLTGSCQFFVDLNVAGGSAPFVLDKMGFVANAGANFPEAPSSSSAGNTSSSSASAPTGAAFQCAGMCAGAVVVSSAQQNFTLGTTGEVWYVLDRIPGGWQGSEMAGRTVEVNGVAVALGSKAWPAASSGKWYVRFSPGNHSWASWSWWL